MLLQGPVLHNPSQLPPMAPKPPPSTHVQLTIIGTSTLLTPQLRACLDALREQHEVSP